MKENNTETIKQEKRRFGRKRICGAVSIGTRGLSL